MVGGDPSLNLDPLRIFDERQNDTVDSWTQGLLDKGRMRPECDGGQQQRE